MQFNLRTLVQAFAVLSIYFGFAFAIPPLLSVPILFLVTALIPSAAVCGIVYGKGSVRAFWIGGSAGGFIPLLFITYYGLFAGFAIFSSDVSGFMFGNEGFYFARTFIVVHAMIFVSGAFAVVFRHSLLRGDKPTAEPSRNVETDD